MENVDTLCLATGKNRPLIANCSIMGLNYCYLWPDFIACCTQTV